MKNNVGRSVQASTAPVLCIFVLQLLVAPAPLALVCLVRVATRTARFWAQKCDTGFCNVFTVSIASKI